MNDESADRETLRAWIGRSSARLASKDFGTGELAQLRRNDPATVVGQPAFHRLIAERDRPIAESEALRWATLVHVMAITAAHGAAALTGTALGRAKVSEARFTKLMAARGEAFRDQVAMAARYLTSKPLSLGGVESSEAGDLGLLLLTETVDEERAATLRFRIAQSYYRALRKQDQPAPSA